MAINKRIYEINKNIVLEGLKKNKNETISNVELKQLFPQFSTRHLLRIIARMKEEGLIKCEYNWKEYKNKRRLICLSK